MLLQFWANATAFHEVDEFTSKQAMRQRLGERAQSLPSTMEGRAQRARATRVCSSVYSVAELRPPSIASRKLFVISKRIVTKFFQHFLYFTGAPVRDIAALSSA